MSVGTLITIEDFERMYSDETYNKELVDGELVDVPGNTGAHNEFGAYLTALLVFYLKEHKLGKVLPEQEYRFGANAHAPDISFFGNEKLRLYDPLRRVQLFVPDLAIEIGSQNDRFGTMEERIQRFRDYGVKEVWIFSLIRRRAFVYSDLREEIVGENGLFEPAAIPGFSIRIGELFERD